MKRDGSHECRHSGIIAGFVGNGTRQLRVESEANIGEADGPKGKPQGCGEFIQLYGTSDFARHPGIAQRYPGPSAFAFQLVANKTLDSRFRGNDGLVV
ncbi:MAG TPA: hypothetical protein VJ862_06260 [Rhodanobacteraceae bacterium]|nr:hypothetical protein [Rhodanobacteraceae bacterium]